MPLTPAQQRRLEDEALKAFLGSAGKLENGFRVNTSAGQVSAIYWSALDPSNEVEIALAPARLTQYYDARTLHAWIELLKVEHPLPCATHKHGSDWPILGFTFAAALAFLRECWQMRKGLLPSSRLEAINTQLAMRTPEHDAAADLEMELARLLPTKPYAVIDLVRSAGISVEPWHVKIDGTQAVKPRSNPAYCYNWSFGGTQEPALACLWHASMNVVDGGISISENLRDLALRLEQIAKDPIRPGGHRDRARQQAARARKLDELIRRCGDTGQEIRVIVNEGDMRSEADLGEDSSFVRVRLLDSQPWQVVAYDPHTGACTLRRATKPRAKATRGPELEATVRFADQHDLLGSDRPDRVHVTSTALRRDRAVRMAVLERAQGRCELCDVLGFVMADGRLYLETHHVQALAEDGADRVSNVVALCPTHHREAHYGGRRTQLRAELEELLLLMQPVKTKGGERTADLF
ncbi:HNH endonuclease [Variovorax sp. ZT5P49]|uniref:HNH endonuclease n=1 Tax=Variovorax sp. ZT5P49 TaxID=3443733 RepID=UPI003F48C317